MWLYRCGKTWLKHMHVDTRSYKPFSLVLTIPMATKPHKHKMTSQIYRAEIQVYCIWYMWPFYHLHKTKTVPTKCCMIIISYPLPVWTGKIGIQIPFHFDTVCLCKLSIKEKCAALWTKQGGNIDTHVMHILSQCQMNKRKCVVNVPKWIATSDK